MIGDLSPHLASPRTQLSGQHDARPAVLRTALSAAQHFVYTSKRNCSMGSIGDPGRPLLAPRCTGDAADVTTCRRPRLPMPAAPEQKPRRPASRLRRPAQPARAGQGGGAGHRPPRDPLLAAGICSAELHTDEPGTRVRGNRRHLPWSRPCLRGIGLRICIERRGGAGASRGHREG